MLAKWQRVLYRNLRGGILICELRDWTKEKGREVWQNFSCTQKSELNELSEREVSYIFHWTRKEWIKGVKVKRKKCSAETPWRVFFFFVHATCAESQAWRVSTAGQSQGPVKTWKTETIFLLPDLLCPQCFAVPKLVCWQGPLQVYWGDEYKWQWVTEQNSLSLSLRLLFLLNFFIIFIFCITFGRIKGQQESYLRPLGFNGTGKIGSISFFLCFVLRLRSLA